MAPLLNIESKKFLIFSLLAPIKSFLFTNYTSFDPLLISPCRRLKYILIIRDRKFRSRELASNTENVTPFLLSKLSSRLLMAYQQNRLFPLKTKKSNINFSRYYQLKECLIQYSVSVRKRKTETNDPKRLDSCVKRVEMLLAFWGVISDFSILNMPLKGRGQAYIFFIQMSPRALLEEIIIKGKQIKTPTTVLMVWNDHSWHR